MIRSLHESTNHLFAGMTAIGMARRELTHMVDTKHPEYLMDINLDASTIPSQMGSNKYASQVGMTSMGQRRWEVSVIVLLPLFRQRVHYMYHEQHLTKSSRSG